MTSKPANDDAVTNDKERDLLLPFGWLSDEAEEHAAETKVAKTGKKKPRKAGKAGAVTDMVDVGSVLQAHLATISSTDAALKAMQQRRKDLATTLEEKADAVEAA